MPNAPQNELTALREAAGFARSTDRAFLRVTGSDAARWLNGMVTNAILTLAPGEGCYNFLLNAQGRIQGDCTVYREPSAGSAEFLLATTAAQAEAIQEHLDRFIIMDDVELIRSYSDESSLIILGKVAPAVLAKLDFPTLDPLRLTHTSSNYGPVLLFTPALGSIPRYEFRAATTTIDGLCNTLSIPEVSANALGHLRLLEGTPAFGQDIRERDLPQETAQHNALHFAKGCYLGQEIVERIHSRGQVHRQFMAFRLTGDLPATLPAPLDAAGKPAGEITSAALVPLPEGPTLVALGYARREAIETRQPLTYPGGIALPHLEK